jgi:hypothetical protein
MEADCFGGLAPVGALVAGDALHQLDDECEATELPVEPKPPRLVEDDVEVEVLVLLERAVLVLVRALLPPLKPSEVAEPEGGRLAWVCAAPDLRAKIGVDQWLGLEL